MIIATSRFSRALVLYAVALLAALPAQAARQKAQPAPQRAPAETAAHGTQSLGKFDTWTAYASQDKTGRVCYLVGQAQKSEPSGFGRKPPMAMVTHRPTEKITNVVSFVEGYPLKEGSEVAVDIGGTKFQLFTKDDSAWARTADLDKAIASALAKGKQAVVKGTPQKGPTTTDVYPLGGFGKALAAIDKACGVQRAEDKPRQAAPAKHPARHKAAHH